jgi:hypothetical protein
VGEFMTQAGCFLDDPVGCDRNVPYMNPQCLFSLHERPPTTFELFQLPNPHIENFTRATIDVLSGFETTDDFELTANPTALRTGLQVYVICRGMNELAKVKPQASETNTYFLLETRTRFASKWGWFWYMAAKNE